MASIVNEWGQPISSGLFKGAARHTRNLPPQKTYMKDISDLCPQRDRETLISASRSLFYNQGLVRGALEGKAVYSIGNAWLPLFKGSDRKWGKQATDWLVDTWYQNCSMTGNMSFQDALYLLSIHTDRDGDVGTVFTFSQTNWPLIQFIPAWRITNKANETTVESGTYKGMRIRDGVIINKNGRAVAYRVETTNGYSDISAQTLSMLYDYNDFTQIRGLPLMTHGIEAMRMAGLSKEYEMFAMLIAGSYALIVNNPEGAPDDDPSSLYGTTNTTTGQGDSLSQTLIDSGMVRYFESNTGSKVEQLKMDRPGTSWENFQNMIAKEVLAGVGWPYSLTIEANSNGTANRLDLQRGELAVSDRQALLKPWARKAVTYAISKAIENGELPSNDEFYKWNFTMPKKLSIDIGRDRSARLKDYEAGITTLETIVAEEGGGDVEEHLFQLSWEKAMRQKIEQEVFASLNVPLSAN